MQQSLTIPHAGGERDEARWQVDLGAAGAAQRWATEQPGLLEEEVAEMATYFPRWVLVPASGQQPARCSACRELIIFRDRAARCARCGLEATLPRERQLGWLGHLPMPVAGLERALRRIRGAPDAGYPLLEVGGALLWLVPVAGFYPHHWPHAQPTLKYDSRLFEILGIASPNATHHIVSGNVMCLYGGEPWREVTMRVVLQQRVVNHLASLLKIADGQRPAEAFAGRQHIYDYDHGMGR